MHHVLVIEDDPALRAVIVYLLKEKGYHVTDAENGKLGVDEALRSTPELVICDIRMPVMDGFQTLSALRSNPSTAAVPFLFLTGEDPRGNLRRAMNLGANDFLSKPFDEHELLEAVRVRLMQATQIRRQSQKDLESLRKNITLAMPHELRTPLTSLLGLAEILRLDIDTMSVPEIRDVANMLYASAQRLHRTLDKFWIYSQIEILASDAQATSAARLQRSPRFNEIVRLAAERTAENYHRSSDLHISLTPAAPAISEQYLDRITVDLVENALKFSENGKPVEVRSKAGKDGIQLTVADKGRGMTPEEVRSISAFGQFDRGTYEQQGLGLGLITVKRLVEIHGGTLHVHCPAGGGTVFTVTFPVHSNV